MNTAPEFPEKPADESLPPASEPQSSSTDPTNQAPLEAIPLFPIPAEAGPLELPETPSQPPKKTSSFVWALSILSAAVALFLLCNVGAVRSGGSTRTSRLQWAERAQQIDLEIQEVQRKRAAAEREVTARGESESPVVTPMAHEHGEEDNCN